VVWWWDVWVGVCDSTRWGARVETVCGLQAAGIVASKWSGDGMPDGGEAQGYQLGITFVCNN
jgi:hypothetical protein